MDEDREIQAISAVNVALKDLSEEERFRVIQWVANKYVQNTAPLKLAGSAVVLPPAAIESGDEIDEEQVGDEPPAYDTFAEMLDASGASKDSERFLAAAYWLQVIKGQQSWKSFEVNKLLKDTGHRIGNIGHPIQALSKTKPAFVVQVSKHATSAGKGSKVLKLTSEGVKKVAGMLSKA